MQQYDNRGEYAEYRGGPRHGFNYISFPTDGALYKATKAVWPWEPPGSYEGEERAVVPSVAVEGLLEYAPVPDPEELESERFVVKCLNWRDYLSPALNKLIDSGLLTRPNDEGEEEPVVFDDIDELRAKAKELIVSMIDDPIFEVHVGSFEWLEGYNNRPQDAQLAWFYELNLAMLTKPTGTLQLYDDLAHAVGPRATEAIRIEVGGTFQAMVASQGGGQLGQAIKTMYYPNDAGVAPAFLLRRLTDFLVDSAWPDIYKHYYTRWEDAAFDIPSRAMWLTATRQQWAAIVQNKIVRTLKRDL